MKRLVLAFLALCLIATGANSYWQSRLQVAIGGAPPSTTTFDPNPAVVGTNQVLSNGNLTDTGLSFGVGGTVRSIANHSTGKYYLEFTCGTISNAGFGIGNSSYPVNSTFFGQTAEGMGVGYGLTAWQGPVTGTTTVDTLVTGHTYAMAVDLGARLAWMKDLTTAGNWNANGTADPATGVNGASMGPNIAAGNIYVIAGPDNTGDSITVNFGATAYVGTPPSGYGNW